jgi:hypothetical protein
MTAITAAPAETPPARPRAPARPSRPAAWATLARRRISLSAHTPREILAPPATPLLFALVIAPALAKIIPATGRGGAGSRLGRPRPAHHPRPGPAALRRPRPHRRRAARHLGTGQHHHRRRPQPAGPGQPGDPHHRSGHPRLHPLGGELTRTQPPNQPARPAHGPGKQVPITPPSTTQARAPALTTPPAGKQTAQSPTPPPPRTPPSGSSPARSRPTGIRSEPRIRACADTTDQPRPAPFPTLPHWTGMDDLGHSPAREGEPGQVTAARRETPRRGPLHEASRNGGYRSVTRVNA